MVRQGGLGRGLASLIPQSKKKNDQAGVNYFGAPNFDEDVSLGKDRSLKGEATQESKFGDISLKSIIEIPIGDIGANPYQPRLSFNQEKLQELAESIKTHGIIQPVVVSRKGIGQYELIAGERRLEAGKLAGLKKIPAVIKKVDDQEKLELALIENIQRHNLDVIEEAKSYRKLLEKFELTQEEIAKRVGKSRSSVANILRLLNLPFEVQKAIQEGKITEGHARTILAISNPEKQRALFEMILKENLTVRQAEQKVREVSVSAHKRKISDNDPDLREKENKLSGSLGTKVRLQKSVKGGKVVIEYYSQEEFDSLFNKLITLEK